METFSAVKDGFCGMLYRPEEDRYPGKAVIVVGGSEGGEQLPDYMGRRFAEAGIAALGVRYWDAPGLPDELVEIPVESIERAAALLQGRGYGKVAMYGISKGGELTLLAASLIPAITCAVALSPLHYVMAGITGRGGILGKDFAQRSSFTWRGEPLPFVPGRMHKAGVLRRLAAERQIDMCFLYEQALSQAPEEAAIRVEKIGGPVLLICPEQDTMWPSAAACRAVEQRLDAHGHPYPVKRLEYRYASHIIVPMDPPMLRFFRMERRCPKECAASRAHAFQQTLDFFRAW